MTANVGAPLGGTEGAPTTRVRILAGSTFLAGFAALAAVLAMDESSIAAGPASAWLVLLCSTVAVSAEVFHVLVPHGDETEDLAFLEASLALSVLVLPPREAAVSQVIGWLVAAVVLRRPLRKTLFNLGAASGATAAFMLAFIPLAHAHPAVSLPSALGVLIGSALFALVNLAALVEVLNAAAGLPRRRTWAEEWQLSLTMAALGSAIAITAVALGSFSWTLSPLAMAPALALWQVYRAAAERANERERARWVLAFSLALASAEEDDRNDAFAPALDAVRRVVRADAAALALPPDRSDLRDWIRGRQSVEVPRWLLPQGWTSGRAWSLDLDHGQVGALLLGMMSTDTLPGRADDSVTPLATAMSGVIRSVRARARIAGEAAKLHAVIQNVSDGIAVIDSQQLVRLWSPALTRMTGIAAAIDRPALDLPESVARLFPGGQDGAESRRFHLEAAGQAGRDLVVASVPIRDPAAGGGDGGVTVFTVHDDTATMRAQRLKSDFVATVSHELRTPLTPIKGYAQLLTLAGDSMEPIQRRDALVGIEQAADQLTRLVDDLLLVSRVTSGGESLRLEASTVRLGDLLDTAVSQFPRLTDRLSVVITDDLPHVRCDWHRALQCLHAVLSNAEQYTPAGSPVEITAPAPADEDGLVRVVVRDHGPGIPAEFQEQVFERFFRLEDPMTMRTRGSGLGLFLARELLTAMSGSIDLESAPGAGCAFTLALPAVPRDAATPHAGDRMMHGARLGVDCDAGGSLVLPTRS